MFQDRDDAGRQLAKALIDLRGEKPVVLAIPRGGAVVAAPVAAALGAELHLLVARKLPFPDDPEAGFGALAEDGSLYFVERARRLLDEGTVARIVAEQKNVIRERIERLRQGEPLPELKGKTLILIDDGLAMGSTMRAAVLMCRKRNPRRIVVAVPVAGPRAREQFAPLVDRFIVLETPAGFMAVAQVYREWRDATDEEVLGLMRGRAAGD
jgi:putative phosphoribosyl transferase